MVCAIGATTSSQRPAEGSSADGLNDGVIKMAWSRAQDVSVLCGEGLDAVQMDLASSASIRTAVDAVLEKTDGELYGLFNNAGFGQPGAVEDLSRDALREQFETNLFGLHELTCQVIPIMRRQGHGRIIQNSSLLGYVALRFRGAYNASKFALEGLTDTLRLELAGSGIHVCLIEPGPIESRFRANALQAFRRHPPCGASPYRSAYTQVIRRLEEPGRAVPFTLRADAILKPLQHALESSIPRARYRVTFPAHLFWSLRRILPVRLLDRILLRVS